MLLSYDNKLDGKPITNLPICGVFALHLITAKPLKELYEECRAVVGTGQKFKGGTFHNERITVLKNNNVEFTDIELTKRMSLKNVIENYYRGKPLMIRVNRHVIIFHRGLIFDQKDPSGRDKSRTSYYRKMATRLTEFPNN